MNSNYSFWKDYIIQYELPLPIHLSCFSSSFFKLILWEQFLNDLEYFNSFFTKGQTDRILKAIEFFGNHELFSKNLLLLEYALWIQSAENHSDLHAYNSLYNGVSWNQNIWSTIRSELQSEINNEQIWQELFQKSQSQNIWHWWIRANEIYKPIAADEKHFKTRIQEGYYRYVLGKKELSDENLKSYLHLGIQEGKLLSINEGQSWLGDKDQDNETMVFKAHRNYDFKSINLKELNHLVHDDQLGVSYIVGKDRQERLKEYWSFSHTYFSHLKAVVHMEMILEWDKLTLQEMKLKKERYQVDSNSLKWSDYLYSAFQFSWNKNGVWTSIEAFAVHESEDGKKWHFQFRINNEEGLWGEKDESAAIRMHWNTASILNQNWIWNAQISSVQLHIELDHYKELKAKSPIFDLTTNQLFYPFGPQPNNGDYFDIDFENLTAINWDSAMLNFSWYALPFQSTPWNIYHKSYPDEMKDAHFKLLVSHHQETIELPLFETLGSGLFKAKSTYELKNLINNLADNQSQLHFEVKGPKDLFHHKMYPHLLASQIKQNLKNKNQKEAPINEPYTPQLEYISFKGKMSLKFEQESDILWNYNNNFNLLNPFKGGKWLMKNTGHFTHYIYLKTDEIKENQDLQVYFDIALQDGSLVEAEMKIFLMDENTEAFQIPMEWVQWDETYGLGLSGTVLIELRKLPEAYAGIVFCTKQSLKMRVKEVQLQCFPVFLQNSKALKTEKNTIHKSARVLPGLKKILANSEAIKDPPEHRESFLQRCSWEEKVGNFWKSKNDILRGLQWHFPNIIKLKHLTFGNNKHTIYVLQKNAGYKPFGLNKLSEMKSLLKDKTKGFYEWEVENFEKEQIKLSFELQVTDDCSIYEFKNKFYIKWNKELKNLLNEEFDSIKTGAISEVIQNLEQLKFIKQIKIEHYYKDSLDHWVHQSILKGQQEEIKIFADHKVLHLDELPELRLFKGNKSFVFNQNQAAIENDYLIH